MPQRDRCYGSKAEPPQEVVEAAFAVREACPSDLLLVSTAGHVHTHRVEIMKVLSIQIMLTKKYLHERR